MLLICFQLTKGPFKWSKPLHAMGYQASVAYLMHVREISHAYYVSKAYK